MDSDECVAMVNETEAVAWATKFLACRGEKLTSWVSTFHRDQLSCRLVDEFARDDQRGSYNWTCQVVFSNGEKWMVRFPRGGKVKIPDEKVRVEVATMLLVRRRTGIPVPEVKAWGLSADNRLGLGPFIITAFVEGVSLGKLLQDADKDCRFLRDIDDEAITTIYQQVARFQLQLAQLDFDKIGGLTLKCEADDHVAAAIETRPVTWKAHEILLDGGIDVLGAPDGTFATTADYFDHIIHGDIRQLHEQLNSVDDDQDARQKLCFWTALRRLVPQMIHPEYNRGPFRLICDDFGPANMIVDNVHDLRIVAVIDWEWSYAGPHQLFWSPPRWLLLQPPSSWSVSDTRLQRYMRYLRLYTTILEEEEAAYCAESDAQDRPSDLMRQFQMDGRMWFHLIVLGAFNGPEHVPFLELRAAVTDFEKLVADLPSSEIETFVEKKMQHLEQYDTALARTRQR